MSVQVNYSTQELAAAIEALYDGILKRVRWTTVQSEAFDDWRTLDIRQLQEVLNGFVAAYIKTMMEYRSADISRFKPFEEAFTLPDYVWRILDDITTADSWDDIPIHQTHRAADGCVICGGTP